MFLYLKEADGLNPGVSWVTETTDASFPSHGEYTMLSFGECPNAVVESRLSQILEDSPLPKYYLSAKACQGILNRAERRGKELPELLKKALIQQSACKETESTEPTPQDVMGADGDGVGHTHLTPSTDLPCTMRIREGCAGGGKGPLIQSDKSGTLATANDQTLFAAGFDGRQGAKAGNIGYEPHRGGRWKRPKSSTF